jgi:muramidase (phage lysozyme)
MTIQTLLAEALDDANVQSFLRVVRQGETDQTDDAYRMMFGKKLFDSFADHPRQAFKSKWGWTSAAGAYQAMVAVPGKVKTDTWGDFIRSCGPHDFSPRSQDLFAVWCIRRRQALEDVLAGRIEQAIRRCNREWASLPESPYGQPTRTMAQALATYQQWGGVLHTILPESPAAPAQEQPVAPFIAAVLPSLIEAVPKLGALFSSGSEVAERNVKAAEMVVGIAKDAIGARNEQELAEVLKNDPSAAAAVRKAVEDNWFAVTEAGGGGIEGARKADADRVSGTERIRDIFKSPSLIVALLLLPLLYLIVASLVGLVGTATWSDEVRSSIIGAVVGSILGSVGGYYFGQVTSRNRT